MKCSSVAHSESKSMDWGMENRLARIVTPATNRCVMLAVDHGYFQGPTTGLERPGETVAPLLPYADALMLTRGVLRNAVGANISTPLPFSAGPTYTIRAPSGDTAIDTPCEGTSDSSSARP